MIKKENILSDKFGFRNDRSITMAVMKLVEDISTALDHKEFTTVIFTDLKKKKKAFDTID